MIFDKEANLKYASLKDEEIDENLTSYNPLPMILNLLYLLVYVQLTIYISQLLLNIFCPDCHHKAYYYIL